MNRAPNKFFFVHVQKTAGTALIERMKRHFAPGAMYPNSTDGDLMGIGPQMSVAQLLRRWDERSNEIEIVSGHFPLATAELLDADFTTLTVLREPVARVLSHLHRHRELKPAVRRASLEDVYKETGGTIRNHMVKMFAMTAAEVAASKPPKRWAVFTPFTATVAHLERAKEQLSGVDVIGLQVRFEEFCDELHDQFGWDLGPPMFANRTAHPTSVSDDLRDRIRTDNALDVEFYEFASRLYDRRSSERSHAPEK